MSGEVASVEFGLRAVLRAAALVVVGCLDTALAHPATLVGRMAAHCRDNGLVERRRKQQ
ncbi:hypothetical protein TSOC_008344 [Tetrabaena socialis]|uniref:Uncharacterized protein n=1 Tax=Tetrabaena socialis TaxID=47790 RepID=A0A2J7ZYQ9_9CHLO|nr:hypothetical protein TSOC_008344 [Tetrabaena socialis]|eukprot:PNH05404.1 hypothetical protein TSOC_008344 [Tetrabaena socialis]